jgi:N-acetyl-1-D-myo-inositol-2-amino-2-deoxy-alpha-D-glucopyranoside deacetylase
MTAADRLPAPRLLFVHAHPDDETLTTGLTMAHYAAAGCDVHVLTCTLGEEGEVIPAHLRHLATDRDDTLGPHRREELREAMGRLGVAHHVLGEDRERGVPSRYRDSGMAGTPSAADPRAFVNADLSEAAGLVAQHLRAVQPDVVVTYDEHGGYAHPDHIRTHEVTMAALQQLDRDPVPAAYVVLTPLQWAVQDRDWLAENVDRGTVPELSLPGRGDPFPPSVVPDEVVTHSVVRPELVARQATALAAHSTQVRVFDGYYALSNDIAARLAGREGFAPVDPATGRPQASGAEQPPAGFRAPDGSGRPDGSGSLDGPGRSGGPGSCDGHDGPVRRGLLGEVAPWA